MWHPDIPEHYRNQIVTGDALPFLRTLPDASVPLFLFSPPYNLGTTTGGGMPGKQRLGHYPADGGMKRRGGMGKWSGGALEDGYGEFNDAMPPAEYEAWQKDVLRECWRALADNGAIYYNHKPRVLDGEVQTPLVFNPGLPVRQIVIWARAGGTNFSQVFYCPTHEWIVIYAKPAFRLKSKGASGVGDVWYFPQETGTWHPAPFPLALAERVIETVQPAFVVDPFMGRGTTAVAAKRAGVGFVGNELKPEYVARAQEWIEATRPMFFVPTEEIEQASLLDAA